MSENSPKELSIEDKRTLRNTFATLLITKINGGTVNDEEIDTVTDKLLKILNKYNTVAAGTGIRQRKIRNQTRKKSKSIRKKSNFDA